MHYKTLQIRNLQEIEKFFSKLVYSGMGKHTSLLQSPYITSP